MNDQQREIQRRLRVIKYAEKPGDVRKASRYSGIPRSTYYRWKRAYEVCSESGLEYKSSASNHYPRQLFREVVDKVI